MPAAIIGRVTRTNPPKSARFWVAYGLFIFAVCLTSGVLSLAVDIGNNAAAAAVVAAALTILSIWFVIVVRRLLRDP